MASTSIRFRRLGRSWHPVIADENDLLQVPLLDEALWVATAAPIATLELDPVFLHWLDHDNDGRIRADELKDAIRWLFLVLSDPAEIREKNNTLHLAKINDKTTDGAALLRSARRLTAEPTLELATVREARVAAEKSGLSEADRVLPTAAADPRVRKFIEHVVEVVGGEAHPCGGLAVSEGLLVKYLDELNLWLTWSDRIHTDTAAILPLGEETASAQHALQAIAAKMEQYFLLCDAVRLDSRVGDLWHPNPAEIDLLDTQAVQAVMKRSPIATPTPLGSLDFSGPFNPIWRTAVQSAQPYIAKLLDQPSLTSIDRAAWLQAWGALAAHQQWIAAKPVTKLDSCNPDLLREFAVDTTLVTEVERLLEESRVAAAELAGIRNVERLILYQAGMLPLVNSFVAHPDLYDLKRTAAYEMGTLILDGRRFNLAVKVLDPTRHEKFASDAGIFVMFVQLAKIGGIWDYEVAVPVTAGERGSIIEGMWGIFLDHKGVQYHAKIRKLILNPISFREALLQPIHRAIAGISGLVDKAGAAQEAALAQSITAKAQAADAAAGKPPPPPPAPPAHMGPTQLAGIAAGVGLAVAAIGSALTYVTETFWGSATALAQFMTTSALFHTLPIAAQTPVRVLSYPVSVLVVLFGFMAVPVLLYTVPVSVSAWLKLRNRDLSALLEGSGWAVNARMYLNKDLARRFTETPRIPNKNTSATIGSP